MSVRAFHPAWHLEICEVRRADVQGCGEENDGGGEMSMMEAEESGRRV